MLVARKLSASTSDLPGRGDSGFVPANVLVTWAVNIKTHQLVSSFRRRKQLHTASSAKYDAVSRDVSFTLHTGVRRYPACTQLSRTVRNVSLASGLALVRVMLGSSLTNLFFTLPFCQSSWGCKTRVASQPCIRQVLI